MLTRLYTSLKVQHLYNPHRSTGSSWSPVVTGRQVSEGWERDNVGRGILEGSWTQNMLTNVRRGHLIHNVLSSGNYQHALQCYKKIHSKFPENVDCLKFLIKLCSDLGLQEVQMYSTKLRKAEKLMETKKQVLH